MSHGSRFIAEGRRRPREKEESPQKGMFYSTVDYVSNYARYARPLTALSTLYRAPSPLQRASRRDAFSVTQTCTGPCDRPPLPATVNFPDAFRGGRYKPGFERSASFCPSTGRMERLPGRQGFPLIVRAAVVAFEARGTARVAG